MNRILDQLEPKRVFEIFEDICNIPHISGHTQALCKYCEDFAIAKGLHYAVDGYGNIVIYKGGTPGYEDHKTVILQGHLDMVGAKAKETVHDFLTDPLKLDPDTIEKGYITALGTTLGGDDGIAVAYMLAILENQEILHPPLEAVFTTDEEIGLLGASAFDYSRLKGSYLLNIDSEEEGIFLTGCAGGMRGDVRLPYATREKDGIVVSLQITGLKGGHSGVSIGTGRPSAVVLLGRVLEGLSKETEIGLVSMEAGTVDNAIAKQAMATVVASQEAFALIEDICQRFQKDFQEEYIGVEEGITILTELQENASYEVVEASDFEKIILLLRTLPYGVQARNASDHQLVETSLNPGILRCSQGEFQLGYSIRSSFESAKRELGDRIQTLTQYLGGSYKETGNYPSWTYNPDSALRPLVREIYLEQYGEEPVFETIHAGLECGIFYNQMKLLNPEGLDIISFGPNMADIHTQDELLYIDSVGRVYEFLIKLLGRL